MRKYLEIAKSQLKMEFAYTAWFWASTLSSLFQLIIVYFFWHAVYASNPKSIGLSLNSMISYIVIATLLSGYVSGVGNQLATDIREGNVAIELMRPYDLLNKLVAVDLGAKFTYLVRNTLPVVVVAFLFLGVEAPHDVMDGVMFVISSILGVFIGTQFDLILGLIAFWTLNTWGIRVLRNAILMFFSGALVPVTMFPNWLQALSQWLPFQYMVYVPVSIYTGTYSLTDEWIALGLQVAWLIGIFAVIRVIWAISLRRVTIFGG